MAAAYPNTKKPVRYLTADDCVRIRYGKQAAIYKAMQHLIKIIQEKLRMAATMMQRDIIYRVPAMLCDFPMYDLQDMLVALKQHFANQKFYVQHLPPDVLYISFRYRDQSD